jgi:hypothetical protein
MAELWNPARSIQLRGYPNWMDPVGLRLGVPNLGRRPARTIHRCAQAIVIAKPATRGAEPVTAVTGHTTRIVAGCP